MVSMKLNENTHHTFTCNNLQLKLSTHSIMKTRNPGVAALPVTFIEKLQILSQSNRVATEISKLSVTLVTAPKGIPNPEPDLLLSELTKGT